MLMIVTPGKRYLMALGSAPSMILYLNECVHQIQRHLGIEGGDEDGKVDPMDDEAYDVDTNMTSDQVRDLLTSPFLYPARQNV